VSLHHSSEVDLLGATQQIQAKELLIQKDQDSTNSLENSRLQPFIRIRMKKEYQRFLYLGMHENLAA
jgi:hypothetical protein